MFSDNKESGSYFPEAFCMGCNVEVKSIQENMRKLLTN